MKKVSGNFVAIYSPSQLLGVIFSSYYIALGIKTQCLSEEESISGFSCEGRKEGPDTDEPGKKEEL